MKDGVFTTVAFSPFRDKDNDVWVFGIHGTASFAKGDDYGWVTHPIQSLPEGYVFKGTYNSSDGTYKSSHGICVHFLPDGGYLSIQLHPGPPMKAEFRDLRIRTDAVTLDANLENTLLGRLEEMSLGDAPSFEGASG